MDKSSTTKNSKSDETWNHMSMVKAVSILLTEIINENRPDVQKSKRIFNFKPTYPKIFFPQRSPHQFL